MAKKRGKKLLTVLLVLALIIIGVGVYFYSQLDIIGVREASIDEIDPSITVGSALDNYFGEGGSWESGDGTVTYFTEDKKVKVVFTLSEGNQAVCSEVYYEDQIAYSGDDANLFLYKVFADSSERYKEYRGDLVDELLEEGN